MEYGLQVTLCHRYVRKEADGTTKEYRNDTSTVLPCVSVSDAKELSKLFEGQEFSGFERRTQVVVRIWNADLRKGIWFNVIDLLQAADEIKDNETDKRA